MLRKLRRISVAKKWRGAGTLQADRCALPGHRYVVDNTWLLLAWRIGASNHLSCRENIKHALALGVGVGGCNWPKKQPWSHFSCWRWSSCLLTSCVICSASTAYPAIFSFLRCPFLSLPVSPFCLLPHRLSGQHPVSLSDCFTSWRVFPACSNNRNVPASGGCNIALLS